MHRYFVLVLLGLFAKGCGNPTAENAARTLNERAEASGSSYRYRVNGNAVERYDVNSFGGPLRATDWEHTSADAALQKDVLKLIGLIEKGRGGESSPRLLGVRKMPGSGNSVKELWFVEPAGGAARYEVTLNPSARGGTDFQVHGPVD